MKELIGKRQETENSLLRDIEHNKVSTVGKKKIIAEELNIFYIFYIYFFLHIYFNNFFMNIRLELVFKITNSIVIFD